MNVAIHGLDRGKGLELASEQLDQDGVTPSSREYDFLRLIKSWELAPTVEEPLVVTIPLVMDDVAGTWTVENWDSPHLNNLVAFALQSERKALEEAQAR